MRLLIWDTECTGLPQRKLPANHPSQPLIVQLSYMVVGTISGRTSVSNQYIKPIRNGSPFVIPEDSIAVHGITNEIAMASGHDWLSVCEQFINERKQCGMEILHNAEFDRNVFKSDHARTWNAPSFYECRNYFCTMQSTTDILKLPGKYGHKWPKLIEAHEHFFGKVERNWHDAMADVEATYELFCKLQEMGIAPK